MNDVKSPVIGTVFDTQLGWISICWSGEKVCLLSFGHRNKAQALRRLQGEDQDSQHLTSSQEILVKRLIDYSGGAKDDFLDVPLDMGPTTRFKERVYKYCRRIPRGKTLPYKMLAELAGSPNAARAVGNAMAHNPIPLIVPCHRVVASTGNALGGFSAPGGVTMKRRLLDLESS